MIGWAVRLWGRVAAGVAHLTRWTPPWSDRRIKVAYVHAAPDRPKARRLYVTATTQGPAFGYLLCPCGCRETLHVRFLPDRRPRWHLVVEADRTATLHPSVWRQVGCRSHFVLTKGKVRWC